MYTVEFWSDSVAAAVDALPGDLLAGFAEVRAALELSPWTVGMPYRRDNPHGPTRTVTFGPEGDDVMVTFGIRHSDARVVTIVQITVL